MWFFYQQVSGAKLVLQAVKVESSEAHKEYVTQVFKDSLVSELSSDKHSEHDGTGDDDYHKVKKLAIHHMD